MGIEPTEDDSHRPPPVLKTGPRTSQGRATGAESNRWRPGVQRETSGLARDRLEQYYRPMQEAHLELTILRCPRCAGQLVLRVLAEERGRSVLLTLDSACIACGVSPWAAPDQRTMLFTPGASI